MFVERVMPREDTRKTADQALITKIYGYNIVFSGHCQPLYQPLCVAAVRFLIESARLGFFIACIFLYSAYYIIRPFKYPAACGWEFNSE